MYNCSVGKNSAPGGRVAIYFSDDMHDMRYEVLEMIRRLVPVCCSIVPMQGRSFGVIIDNNFQYFLQILQQTPGMQEIAQRVRGLLAASTPKPSPFGSGRKPGPGSGGGSGRESFKLEPRRPSGIPLND